MANDRDRIDAGEPCDEREQAVPERKRVAGVQAAVAELVDRAERDRAEIVELADAAEVEERVSLWLAREVPEREAEPDPGEQHELRRRLPRCCLPEHPNHPRPLAPPALQHETTGEHDVRERRDRVEHERQGQRFCFKSFSHVANQTVPQQGHECLRPRVDT